MTVYIKLADTTSELDEVFRLRHRVMVEQEQYVAPQPDARMVDRFDAYPDSVNVVANVDRRIVGAVRFAEDGGAGTSADEYFDFRPHLPAGARPVASSMLVLDRAYRGMPRIVFAMFGMGYHWAIGRGATHVLGAANPERRAGFMRSGYRPLAEEFFHGDKELPVLPIMLDLERLDDRALDFLRKQDIGHWLRSSERQFHVAGEAVMRRGEPGDKAYVIVDGHAEVRGTGGETVAELGPGTLFGELALLAAGVRTADVIAATDLDLMTLGRDGFREQLRTNPEASERMIELLATRLASGAEQS